MNMATLKTFAAGLALASFSALPALAAGPEAPVKQVGLFAKKVEDCAKDAKKVKIYKRNRDVMKMESDELLKNYIVKMPKPSHISKPPAVALHQSPCNSAKVRKSPVNSV